VGDPNKRFDEDKLRVLRAVRFAVQLGFEIEKETWEAAKAFAPQISQVAWERIQVELTKILISPSPRRGLELLDEAGLNPIREMKLSTLKRLLRREDFKDLLELHRADCLASHGGLELYDLAKAKLAEFEQVQAAESLRPAPLLDGADLISMGYKPGPQFAVILTALEDEQLEGRLESREKALEFVKNRFA
jgi:tRNA nucleotidyltransferase/poly(A) polymerase